MLLLNCLSCEHLLACFQVVALLVYSDNGKLVESSGDGAEAPLLTSSDGTELPSTERPVTLRQGRAIFKLKISQVRFSNDLQV